jgi:hypothetical protein
MGTVSLLYKFLLKPLAQPDLLVGEGRVGAASDRQFFEGLDILNLSHGRGRLRCQQRYARAYHGRSDRVRGVATTSDQNGDLIHMLGERGF